MFKKNTLGFSLIELMIAIAIVAIIGAIAFPSYTSYVTSARRADGQTALLDLANRMERYFTMNNSYVGASLTTVGANANSPEGFYRLSITNTAATSYTIQAAPQAAQASDTTCGSLTLNELGQKGETGSGSAQECW